MDKKDRSFNITLKCNMHSEPKEMFVKFNGEIFTATCTDENCNNFFKDTVLVLPWSNDNNETKSNLLRSAS